MYGNDEIATRSKENVKDNAEVFTPFKIVDKMLNLLPNSAWADPQCGYIEPTCGNGQFLVKIFEKRIANGIDIITALNTMVGMDISQENILDSHKRLYERVCAEMRVQGITPYKKKWFDMAIQAVAIIRNNIFKVKDSLHYIEHKLENKKFFNFDPTGHNQVLTIKQQETKISKIKSEFRKTKENHLDNTLAPFFGA
jgi:transcriptional regulator CtsR